MSDPSHPQLLLPGASPGWRLPGASPERQLPAPIREREVPGLIPGSDPPGSHAYTTVNLRTLRPPVRTRGPRWGPILPFFGVLLRGFDAPVFTPADARPRYHPSVGYAREIYVAIAMNGFVDLLGFGYLFHSYLASFEPAWAGWVIAGFLGLAFSTAFSTFAVSLVRKPLPVPQLQWRALGVAGALVGVGLLGQLIVAMSHGSEVVRILGVASAVPLGLGVLVWLLSTFGFQDGAMVFTRASVMAGVAYLVAGPLHEVMFQKEIDDTFRSRALDGIENEWAARGPELAEARSTTFGSCMRSRSVPVGSSCEEPKITRARADLLVQAIAFVEQEEITGMDAAASRTWLLGRAREVDASAVVALLGGGATGRAGVGPRYQQALAMKAEALRAAGAAQDVEESCVAAVATCEAAAAADPRVVSLERRLSELQADADRVQSGAVQPGAIERALALEALVRGAGDARRVAILDGKMLAAWFLAMVMPIIVLVMKCSAGDRLEPYLRRRWTGR